MRETGTKAHVRVEWVGGYHLTWTARVGLATSVRRVVVIVYGSPGENYGDRILTYGKTLCLDFLLIFMLR